VFPLLEPSGLAVPYRSVLLILFTFTPDPLSCSYCHIAMPATRSARKVTKKTPYAKSGATSPPNNGKTLPPELRLSTMGPSKRGKNPSVAINDTFQMPTPMEIRVHWPRRKTPLSAGANRPPPLRMPIPQMPELRRISSQWPKRKSVLGGAKQDKVRVGCGERTR
jgi:hypothetical protein